MSCVPTYMFTHRFGEADASGHRRCSCGATTDENHFLYGKFVACSHFAPSIWCAPYEPAFARGLAERLMGEADGVTCK